MDEGASGVPERPRRRRPLIFGVVAVIVLIVAAGLFVAARRHPRLPIRGLPMTVQAQPGGDLSVKLSWLAHPREHVPDEDDESHFESNAHFAWEPADREKTMYLLGGFNPSTQQPVLEARFDLKEDGRPTDDWMLHCVAVRRPGSGPRNCHVIQSQALGEGRMYAWFGPTIAGGGQWLLDAAFQRLPTADFAPDEVCTVSRLPLPEPDAPVELSHTVTCEGLTLDFLAVVPPGRVTYERGSLTAFEPVEKPESSADLSRVSEMVAVVESPDPTVAVMVTNDSVEHLISVRVTDDEGRELNSGRYDMLGQPHCYVGVRLCDFTLKPDSKCLNVTFTVQKRRHAEFVIERSRG